MNIPGLSGEFREIEARYDYSRAPTTCPNCKGLGLPWGGWFTCNFDDWGDEQCGAVALVSDGRCFVPVSENKGET